MTTLYVTHPRYTDHDLSGHHEHAGRIRAVWTRLDEAGLSARMVRHEPAPAAHDLIAAVHTPAYLDLLARTEMFDRMMRLDADTYCGSESYEIARLAAGGMVDAISAVMRGEARNALSASRPPGHHAMPDRAMGFCLLGNVAIGARAAQTLFGVERVMIVDYDVHHGNGTEAMFYDDPSVLFVSVHQAPLYPGTGALSDIGSGAGQGYTLNIPIAPGNGDRNYGAIVESVIQPAAERFQPKLILASVGHDAHWGDPLAGMRLTLTGYAQIARALVNMAESLCGGKIVFVMEGGYNLDALSYGMANIARVMLGDADSVDPMGAPDDGRGEPDVRPLIERVRRIHSL